METVSIRFTKPSEAEASDSNEKLRLNPKGYAISGLRCVKAFKYNYTKSQEGYPACIVRTFAAFLF